MSTFRLFVPKAPFSVIASKIKRLEKNCLSPFASMADWRWNSVCQTNILEKEETETQQPKSTRDKKGKKDIRLCVILR